MLGLWQPQREMGFPVLAHKYKYTVEIKGFGSQNAIAGSVVRTDAFDRKYAYSGEDLGAMSRADFAARVLDDVKTKRIW